ncbi:ATP-binding cassette domain-containing protein [Hyphomonas sp.]|uniref:ATP-binding cassette domain-containing protein n=1 Tax=Hyphomonas sp. TaxID=87 RepID=UPI003527D412
MLKLWKLLGRPAKVRFGLALLLSALAGASSIALLGLSGWFLSAAAIAGSAGAGYVFNHLYPSAGVRAAAFSRVLTRYGEQLVGHDATLNLSARLRPQLFAASAATQRGFTSMPARELSSLIDDVDAAEAGFLRVYSPAAAVIAGVAVALGFVFASDWISGLLALGAFLCTGWIFPAMAVQRSHQAAEAHARQAEVAREQTSRLIENAIELDILGAIGREAALAQTSLEQQVTARDSIEEPYRNLGAFTATVGLALALLVLWRAAETQSGIAMATGAALALMAAFESTGAMLKVFDARARSGVAADRLASRLQPNEASWDPPLESAPELDSLFPLTVDGLMAQAAPNAPVIGPLTFTVEPGSLLQLIGPSGSGKTTVAEALMRLHPVSPGTVHYGATPAESARIASVLARIAISPQFPAFLPGTLADQMRLAAPEATDEEIKEALRTACADGFVTARPEGLNIMFSEGNLPFSGGELRRIGLARALLANPEVLILDEPFAGLEADLARRLAANLDAWACEPGRALIVLAHKPVDALFERVTPQQVCITA